MSTHALVTGASRGIGKAIATHLLDAGFRVTGTARTSSFPHSFTEDGNFTGLLVDFSNPKQLENELKPLFESEEAPSIIVCNAGISEEAPFEGDDEQWERNWDRTLMVNLKAPALITKWAMNRWIKHGIEGIAIYISSRAGHRGDTGPFASYAASKSGLTGLAKSIARSYGKKGITTYDIAPGFVATDMMEKVKNTYPEGYIESSLALESVVDPNDIGKLVRFIAEGSARHMTGQTFHINSGSYLV